MKTKTTIYFIFFLLLLSISFAQPFTQVNVEEEAKGLTIVYPKIQAYPSGQQVKLSFDVLDYNNSRLDNSSTTCIFNVVNETGDIILATYLQYDTPLEYWYVEGTFYKETQHHNYYVHCDNTALDLQGFVSDVFYVTEDGKDFQDNNVLLVPIFVFFVISIYVIMASQWNFSLLGGNDEKTSVIKVLIYWLLLWLQPLFVQIAIKYANEGIYYADIISLLNVLYQVTVWVAYIISVYLAVFFLYELLVKLPDAFGRKR